MIGPSRTVGRVSMFRHHDFYAHFIRALHHGVKVIHLEPQQHAISVRLVIAVTDWPVMVLHSEFVQLENELSIGHQLFVFGASVIAPTAQ